jgi:hypothetical protein
LRHERTVDQGRELDQPDAVGEAIDVRPWCGVVIT